MALATKQPEFEGIVGRFANFKAIFILIEAYARISPDLGNRLLSTDNA